jgi:xanthine dehydrogenase FAD-binding subunit
LHDFITGPGKTQLAEGELLTAIECDALPGYGGSFEKVGHRRSLVISLACLAFSVRLDADGRLIEDVRIGLAGVCPMPTRLREVEGFLRGKPLGQDLLEQAADMPLDLVQSRTRRGYRRDILRGFMMRGLITASKRAGADPAVVPRELEAAYV